MQVLAVGLWRETKAGSHSGCLNVHFEVIARAFPEVTEEMKMKVSRDK